MRHFGIIDMGGRGGSDFSFILSKIVGLALNGAVTVRALEYRVHFIEDALMPTDSTCLNIKRRARSKAKKPLSSL